MNIWIEQEKLRELRCESCEAMDSRGSWCTCKFMKRRIPDIRTRPPWCPREPLKEEQFDIIRNFLFGKHRDRTDFPDSTLFIGTGFEIGGTHEDWGFGIFRKSGKELKLLASGRTIYEAIEKAKVILKCTHEYDERGWCVHCKTHITLFK